jgi:hypothetical protein
MCASTLLRFRYATQPKEREVYKAVEDHRSSLWIALHIGKYNDAS